MPQRLLDITNNDEYGLVKYVPGVEPIPVIVKAGASHAIRLQGRRIVGLIGDIVPAQTNFYFQIPAYPGSDMDKGVTNWISVYDKTPALVAVTLNEDRLHLFDGDVLDVLSKLPFFRLKEDVATNKFALRLLVIGGRSVSVDADSNDWAY